MVAVISTNAQERGRGDRERRGSDASWAREAMERYRGSGRVNPLDPESVKRRLDYAVKEGLMTREQADKLQAAAKKRVQVAQRENNDRRGRGDHNEGRDHENQANDRQDQVRKDYEARRKRIEAGVKSGKIKREDAAKMYEGLRKWMEGASHGVGNNEGRGRENQSNDRQADARKGYEIRRKRIEEGVRSGKIKREDAAKMMEDLRKRMEAGKRGGADKNEESKEDPRLARYRATERHFAAEVKAGKLSKEDAQKKLIEVRKQLWNSNASRSSQSKKPQSKGSSRGYLGASVESSSRPRGLRVQQVYANTAAARAKLKKGDIILKMNGAGVTSSSGLIGQLSKTKPGQKATLLVSSGGKTRTVQVQLGGSYSTRSSAQSSSKKSNSSQSKKPQTKGKDHDHDKGDQGKKDHGQDRVQHIKQAIDHLRAAGRHDLAEEVEKRVHEAHRNQDQHRHEHKGHADHGDRGRRDRVEEMRKAWEERMKQWREAQEKANNAKRPSQSRGSSGTDWRKAIEERMKKAREDRERTERNSRGRSNDRGEDMRKVWEERMKQWREARERDGDRGGRRPETQRGSQGRGPGAQHGSERGRGPQGRGPSSQRGPERGHGPQGRGSQNQRGPQKGRGPQSGGPGRGGPRGR